MQEALRKKEYWISLGTTEKLEAFQLAPDLVNKKRREISLRYNKAVGTRRPMMEFSEDQRLALFRECYAVQLGAHADPVELFQSSSATSFAEFLDQYEAATENLIAILTTTRGEHPRISQMMLQMEIRNGIKTRPGSRAERQLRQLCVDSIIEAKRNELAIFRTRSIHANPNPEIVDASTGRPIPGPSLADILNMPEAEEPSLMRLVEAFIANPNKSRTEKTKKSIRGSMKVVIEILGDKTLPGSITEADCEKVRDILIKLPPNFGKLPLLKDKPIGEMARIAETKQMDRLSPTGVNTYLKWLTSFLLWCQRKGHIAKVPTSFSEIKVADPERRADKRLPFSNEQLQDYFQSRIFQNQESTNCIYWVSLIALWNGMRSNEICQIDVADITEIEDIWGFDVTNISASGDQDKKIKTGASIRLVPIHPRLIEFGFLDFYRSRPRDAKLFGDITCGADGYYSSTFSKKSNRYLAEVGVHGPKHKFHSFRHNFRDALRRGRVDREIGQALGGWQRGNTSAFDIYGSGFPLEDLADELQRVDYPKVDWEHFLEEPT